ncbi:MAG: hypothetical protein Q4C12_04585 [Clostridia bacterium]|nr:hypothetical protein [Clostridia bacterium]
MKKIVLVLFMISLMLTAFTAAAYAEDVALFDFVQNATYEADLNDTYATTADAGYAATGGARASEAYLRVSVNGTDWRKLEWSAYDGLTGDEYQNPDMTQAGANGEVPIFDASSNHVWNNPYIEIFAVTTGYENITFSAMLGGSNKGPRDYVLSYSLDGVTYTQVSANSYRISENKVMERAFRSVALPAEAANASALYIRIQSVSGYAISGELLSTYPSSGHGAVNHAALCGTAIGAGATEPTEPAEEWSGVAAFEFERTLSTEESLNDTYNTTADEGYAATGGENASSARLFASVDGETYRKLEWSYTDAMTDPNQYKDENGDLVGINGGAPAMDPSQTVAWGTPFFMVKVSTLGYEDITFSALLGGSKKGPANYKLQYSLDGVNFTDVAGALYSITTNKRLQSAFSNTPLPDEVANQENVYIRMIISDNITIAGAVLSSYPNSGQAAINNVYIGGSKISGLIIEEVDVTNGISVTFSNNSEESNVSIIAALYENDALTDVTVLPIEITSGRQTHLVSSDSTDGKSVKILIWKSMDTMMPIAQSFTDK